ncbi:membrane protein [Stutzerimonas stutzeri]|uniref:Membrane protein n=1 Tax=Stutzerimonas stutzeri TaxID=316 RepID=W8R7C7_STUST|nr:DMT family transporter [Stutzerimonas stutzeri]AHL75488.1 membrane protein [Stutzerimonas stutzeri]MCQ4327942.1 DMT family transporter [Stutzerimonas stutzeri]
MDSRKPLDAMAVGLMLLLCLIWSAQQIALKATAADFSPVLQIALRSGIGALLVATLMLWRRERLTVAQGMWKPGCLAGICFALEFLLVGEAVRHTSAGHVVVFVYTAPVFAALGLHWKLPNERLALLQWVGVGLAFAGIAVAFLRGAGADAGLTSVLWGDFLALLAGAAWGATTVLIRASRLSSLPATQTLLYQLLMGFVLLLPIAALIGHTTFNPTPLVWLSLGFQSLIVSFASFLLWFALLRRYLASRLGVLSFLTPLLGVALGAWLLAEPVEPSFIAGAILALSGIVLVSGYGWIASVWRR